MAGLLILADDLSGALDTGVQFSRAGFSVEVYPFYQKAKDILSKSAVSGPDEEGAAVRVINTASRHLDTEKARERILSLKSIMHSFQWVYKKTDSTLRGHTGAELEAFMEARNVSLLPFVPAYPELGRTVSGGIVFLNGTPLDKTSMASDPLNPIRNAGISQIIREESSLRVISVAEGEGLKAADFLKTGFKNIKNEPEKNLKSENEILVFDSSSEKAIDEAGTLLENAGLLGATAGSAGFARFLAEKLPLARSGRKNKISVNKDLPLLIISGSVNPVSKEQILFAYSSGLPLIELSSSVLAGVSKDNGVLSAAKEKLKKLLSAEKTDKTKKRTALVALNGDLPTDFSGGNFTQSPAVGLAEFVAEAVCGYGPFNLAVSGGDTLLALIEALGEGIIKPLGEIENGVVVSGVEGAPFSLVSKSGAFGGKETMLKIADFFR